MTKRFHQNVTRISCPAGTPEDAWDLYCAAAEGHLPTIRACIEKDAELIHHQIWYEFPIHFAVRGGHVDAVELLLEAGTNPAWSFFRYSSWQKLLPIAEQRGYSQIHTLLIDEMQRRFNYDSDYKPLFKAIGTDADFAEFSRLVDEQPELIHVGDEHGNRALHWAILARRIPMIERLLDAGADIHARRADLQTPLHLSMLGGDYWFESSDNREPGVDAATVTDLLLDQGAEYEFSLAVHRGDRKRIDEILANDPGAATRLNDSRRSPLAIASARGHIDVARLFLDKGADPNLPEECCPRGAALISSCWRTDIEMARLLLEHGADTRAESDSSGSCFSAAEQSNSERKDEFIQLLKRYDGQQAPWQISGAKAVIEWMRTDESIADNHATVAGLLSRVVSTEDLAVLREFVDRFGEKAIRNLDPGKGWNMVSDPLFLDQLIQHGMDINRPDWFGRTCLHWCAKHKDTERASLYLDRGANINAIDFMSGTTVLGIAAMNGNMTMVKFLLGNGADTSLPKEHEWAQPLMLATREKKWDVELAIRTHVVLKQLAEDPASLLQPNSNILHSAAHYSEEEIVRALLEANADIEASILTLVANHCTGRRKATSKSVAG